VKKNLILALLCVFSLWRLGAAEAAGVESASGGVVLNIRYFDKRVYYLEKDPILVRIEMSNNGTAPFRFKLADERAFSVDFEVRSTSNREEEAANLLLKRRGESRQVYFRDVLVEPGESFSFVENLKDYALLNRSGSYVVQARVYPELLPGTPAAVSAGGSGGQTTPIVSNRLNLTIRPSPISGPDGVPLELDVDTNAVLAREKLPPDEVIKYTLQARQKAQWEKFFLYIDLEAMLTRNPSRRRKWQAESAEGRAAMLKAYREELQSATIDGDISAIPMNFIIERTAYNPGEGTVTALEFFKVGAYTERKRFTYYLRKEDEVWTIVDYTVVNLGTE